MFDLFRNKKISASSINSYVSTNFSIKIYRIA